MSPYWLHASWVNLEVSLCFGLCWAALPQAMLNLLCRNQPSQWSQLSLETSHDFSTIASAFLVAMLLGFQDCWRGKEVRMWRHAISQEFDLNASQGYADHPCQYIDHECTTKNINLNMPGCASSTCQCRFHLDLWICHSTVAVFFFGESLWNPSMVTGATAGNIAQVCGACGCSLSVSRCFKLERTWMKQKQSQTPKASENLYCLCTY